MVIILIAFIISILLIIIGTEDDSKFFIVLGVALAFFGEFSVCSIYEPDRKTESEVTVKEERYMSTRAHIRIIDGDELFQMYHHCDGYPEGVGADLKKFLDTKCGKDHWDGEEIANAVAKGNVADDNSYEITSCIHGDEDYVYVIDCKERKLRCYKHSYGEDFKETAVEKNLVKIN